MSTLRCTSFSDVLAAIDSLPLTSSSSAPSSPERFTPAQALVHCAQSIEYTMSGYPKLRSGFFRATIGPIVKRRFISRGAMKHDITAPVPGAPAVAADTDLSSALARLRAAIASFTAYQGAYSPHLAYGPCTRAEYEALQSMHVAEHLNAFM